MHKNVHLQPEAPPPFHYVLINYQQLLINIKIHVYFITKKEGRRVEIVVIAVASNRSNWPVYMRRIMYLSS